MLNTYVEQRKKIALVLTQLKLLLDYNFMMNDVMKRQRALMEIELMELIDYPATETKQLPARDLVGRNCGLRQNRPLP